MRILHTADWHLGRRLFDADLVAHQRDFGTWLVDTAVTSAVDLVIVAGDIYDRAIPPPEAVAVLDTILSDLAAAEIPVLLISGNHDAPVRLGFGAALAERAGVHWRTRVADLDRPVLLHDEHGPVAVYGIPFLHPDAVCGELQTERSHSAVLASATHRIRADAAARGIDRVVVTAHAFVTGATSCDSERDISVGGVQDVPAGVFAGFRYVALGHLHGRQSIGAPAGTTVAYSGSPLAYSFSERGHIKGVSLVDVDGHDVRTEQVRAPVPHPLHEATGTLAEVLERASGDEAHLADAWVKVTLTDVMRPNGAMEALRRVWPHTLTVEHRPAGAAPTADATVAHTSAIDPTAIACDFLDFVGGTPATRFERYLLEQAVGSAIAEVS